MNFLRKHFWTAEAGLSLLNLAAIIAIFRLFDRHAPHRVLWERGAMVMAVFTVQFATAVRARREEARLARDRLYAWAITTRVEAAAAAAHEIVGDWEGLSRGGRNACEGRLTVIIAKAIPLPKAQP